MVRQKNGSAGSNAPLTWPGDVLRTPASQMTDSDSTKASGLPGKHVLGVIAFQVVTLTGAAWFYRYALNPDAVAYLQIASHYAQGRPDLAISGHWGPLISWLIVPFLKLGLPPLAAGRVVMGFSAVVFLAGAGQLLSRFEMPKPFRCFGLWISALVSIPWSVENITPDLLLAGLVSFAIAGMMTPAWLRKPSAALGSGIAWGLAYLCKAIALPLGILTGIGITLMWWGRSQGGLRAVFRSLALAFLGLAFVSLPWIGVLSSHYGKLTFGTSARFNHALAAAPGSRPVFLLDQGFHHPTAGRVTVWEEPSLPFPDWSPVASWGAAMLQLRIMARNVPVVLFMLTSVSLAFPVLVVRLILRRRESRIDPRPVPRGWWTLIPVLFLGGLYLPNYLLISEQRYFYAAFPLLWVAAASMMAEARTFGREWTHRHGAMLLAVAFVAPTFARSVWRLDSTRMAGECAHILAERIESAGLAGPMAGSGKMPGGRAGLYVAFLLRQPWFGDEPSPSVSSFKRSGAALIVVRRDSTVARELAAAAEFRDLDPQLFGDAFGSGKFPLQVFENVARSDAAPWECLNSRAIPFILELREAETPTPIPPVSGGLPIVGHAAGQWS